MKVCMIVNSLLEFGGLEEFATNLAIGVQRQVGSPYLNVFSNYCLYDACLQCLPGHDVVHERIGLYKMGLAMACKRLKWNFGFPLVQY